MDAYRRFAGSGDAPPTPQQQQQQHLPPPSHPNPNGWYPGPAPPYHAPHPNHPYPPQQHQWGHPPPPDIQHQHRPPQPLPQYTYQPQPPPMQPPPPPAPGNPWPPHHAGAQPPAPSYPPPLPGQAWTNHSWAQNDGYTDDWATKAKEWAAAKSGTQNHQIQQHVMPTNRTEVHHYGGYHDQYQHSAGVPAEPLHPPIPQSNSDQLPFQMTGQSRETNYLLDRGPMAPPPKSFSSFPSTYEQEVSYNYSSAPAVNGDAMLQYPSSQQAQTAPAASAVQDGFPRGTPSMPGHGGQSFRMMVDPSDQPLEFNSRKPDMAVHQAVNINSTVPTGVSEHDTVASTQSWGPSAVGYFPRAPVPPQMDPSVHAAPLFGAVAGSNYVPPAAFGFGSVTEAFPTDASTLFNVAERSKKPPVPNWLREELLKKKSTPVSASVQHSTNFNSMESEDAAELVKRADQTDSRSIGPAKLTEDDDADEDEIEEARMAAINKEIKRVLTEVLLKVTDDLFDEIATKVLNEDDSSTEPNDSTRVSSLKERDLGEPKAKSTAKVVVSAKPANISSIDHLDGTGLSSPKGALLGLASYDSDDSDDDEGEKSIDGERHMNHSESAAIQSVSSGDDKKSNVEGSQRKANAESERELHIDDTQNGEFPLEAKTSIQPINEKAHGHADVDCQNGKASSTNHAENNNNNNAESTHRHLARSIHEEDLVKDAKLVHRKDLESSITEKYNDGDNHSMHGNIDKKGIKEEKGSGRYAKHGLDERNNAKGDRKDFPEDARERKRDSADRRDKRKDGNDDRSRQIMKSSASHSSRRSRSPSGRSHTRKESSSHVRRSVSSDEPSDHVKKRKTHSRKDSMSPSPPRSRNRRVSRSPHSKHSHRRHSPYSSAERKKRSRSRTPVKRR
ncbi:hypothetical protein BRADI_5g24937v3 [Brachypodium distachyon]|uniref:Uncharacterized protein n=1 Tax=Brachypodium distachyon TaxID=15368 RepID=A0A2K2CJ63_BRADI|nr:hypothetical protein BRADI_5g24937v3 [Brachypodium distachyon]